MAQKSRSKKRPAKLEAAAVVEVVGEGGETHQVAGAGMTVLTTQ